ncbi:hypothetical protein SCB49_10812 [unidentified eubacterium SCB49]|nr:hypothetical protein SCB49_10812 [unidentified eubacterium SCB49]
MLVFQIFFKDRKMTAILRAHNDFLFGVKKYKMYMLIKFLEE